MSVRHRAGDARSGKAADDQTRGTARASCSPGSSPGRPMPTTPRLIAPNVPSSRRHHSLLSGAQHRGAEGLLPAPRPRGAPGPLPRHRHARKHLGTIESSSERTRGRRSGSLEDSHSLPGGERERGSLWDRTTLPISPRAAAGSRRAASSRGGLWDRRRRRWSPSWRLPSRATRSVPSATTAPTAAPTT